MGPRGAKSQRKSTRKGVNVDLCPECGNREKSCSVLSAKNQTRFSFPLGILPLTTYLQRHADEVLTERLLSEAGKLSENQPHFLFYPHRALLPQTNTPNLIKQTYVIPAWAEQYAASTFALFEVPSVIESCLWHDDPDDKCYAVINSATSRFFRICFV
ncbi:hypothetical protein [Aggregatibacter actinomycetemcomitans]|uniref:hypothetical protein n=1 Tax=Aggregatibacter actinomycetemcomitans TaxID=714 RepID=UPI0021CBE54B|nr:hypothetical protein [Aggregatibacter actinomycetemcomitans]